MADDASLKCRLVLGGEIASFSAAVAYFRLERADEADRSAELISEQVLRGAYQQFAAKGLIRWETAQDIAAVKVSGIQKNSTPSLTQRCRKAGLPTLLSHPETRTERGQTDAFL